MTTTLSPEQEQLAALIDALDLDPIAFKLMHPHPGETVMTLAEADQLIAAYRCFLKLCVWYPDAKIVPSKDIDEVWHNHVLDTAKYAEDCELIGRFLHHYPYFGLGGPEDEAAWRAAYADTHELFYQHFGIDLSARQGGDCHEGGGSCAGESLCTEAPCERQAGRRPRPDRRPTPA
ncbi:hypothetical protein [Nonomuraea sp. NPDC049141]|uniref:glycine-rich domain-containing protein n=1 Tax=Nonomuraea sp. NPDC049141 TaxID=3155500 RepID=UPI0033C7C7B6